MLVKLDNSQTYGDADQESTRICNEMFIGKSDESQVLPDKKK